MNYFFVFQNKTFKEEHFGGFLWAPKADKNGHTKSHWTMMTKVKKGDVIIHSVHKAIVAISFATSDCSSSLRPDINFNDWEEDGWGVDTEYHIFPNSIITSDYIDELRKLQPEKYAPFNSRGRGNTGYLFAANSKMFEFIIRKTAEVQNSSVIRSEVLELLNIDPSQIANEQELRDKQYPREFISNLDISISDWRNLLQDQAVFFEKDIELLKRIYLADNHAVTCYELGLQEGVSPSTYISPVVALGKRISKTLSLPSIIGNDGKETWWRIPFWGSYHDDGHFEWKLRPELAKAMESIFPGLKLKDIKEKNLEQDSALIESLKKATLKNLNAYFKYKGNPKEKQDPIYSNGQKSYPRDRQTAINALAHAHYLCEIDENHPTFLRKNSDKNYTEPHHLVPMAYSDNFNVSLDIEENIVSLCSNCHNQVHYGEGAEELLRKLYSEKKQDLEQVGIEVTLKELLNMY